MFERFTPEARRSIFFTYVASQHGLREVGTEHLLLGLVREDITFVNRFLSPEVTEESLRSQIQASEAPSMPVHTYSPEMRFTDESKRILSFAAEEADQMSAGQIGIDHLLLGLLREHGCSAARLLRERGASFERVRKELAKTPYQSPPREERMLLEVSRMPRILTDAPPQALTDVARLIFFAKCEASRLGSATVETQHLLLAVLREEKAHFSLFLPSADSKETICRYIEEHSIIREKVPMNSKLSLSDECERALAYAEEEAANLSRERVGPEHLILGLLREEGSFAAQLLREHGAEIERIRSVLAASPQQSP